MEAKIKKLIIKSFIFLITLIYLSISVYAVGTFNAKNYYVYVYSRNESGLYFREISELPLTMPGTNLDGGTLFIGFKTNQVIQDGYVIVISVEVDNMAPIVSNLGVGTMASGAITGSNSGAFFLDMPYEQEIIRETVHQTASGTRVTVTFKAQGIINQYPFLRIDGVTGRDDSVSVTGNLTLVSMELYETVEDAAGSGTTPEEMREVLEEWTQETLLPGMEESVHNGVTSGMEAALEDEKQQASSGAQGGLDELAGALSGVTEDITQAKQSFETLGSALSYSGTSASLTFPAMTVPFLGTISEAQPINLTEQIDNIMPPTLLLIIRCALSIGIVSYPIFELITQLRKLLDKG